MFSGIAEAQEGKVNRANPFQASACVKTAHIPLGKASHAAKPSVSGWGNKECPALRQAKEVA